MLWLALRLPLLPLEVFPDPQSPRAVIANERIVVCDALAAKGGVVSGMRLADAWALLPELTVLERDVAREIRQLEALACWAGGFTSEVSLSPPAALLLEVQGSLRLFDGLESLLVRIREGISGQGHAAALALAPTPGAALWLAAGTAAAAEAAVCTTVADMRAALARLPVAVLGLPPAQAQRVAGFGVRCLGDLLRLPRAGLAQRLGSGFAVLLARAMGELPDPQPRFCFPETFHASLELPARVVDAPRLLFAAQRLVQQLCGWLAARSSGIAACVLQLQHERSVATRLSLAFAASTRDPERIVRVLRERLARCSLQAPVDMLVLQAERPEPLPGREGGLFGDTAGGEGITLLVERLQARLGAASVHALAVRPEHRPELASSPVPPGSGVGKAAAGPRPCWLLPQPQALPEIDGRPQRDGPLTLLAGPERIESGWWDGGEPGASGDVRRDYFVAISSCHEWLWIFQCREGWFLHGFYA